jgi:hypothetical protein
LLAARLTEPRLARRVVISTAGARAPDRFHYSPEWEGEKSPEEMTMRTSLKYATALTLAGALAIAAATPSQARWHGGGAVAAGAVAGLAAGAIIGSAANNAYYNDGYYYGPGPYAYEPAPVYDAPTPVYRGCWHATDSDRGFGYYGACEGRSRSISR